MSTKSIYNCDSKSECFSQKRKTDSYEEQQSVLQGSKSSSKRKRKRQNTEFLEVLSSDFQPRSQFITGKERHLEKERMKLAKLERKRKMAVEIGNTELTEGNEILVQNSLISNSFLHLFHTSTRGFTKTQLSELKSLNIKIKVGRFQLWEDAIIRRNYELFKKDFDLEDDLLLLGINFNPSKEVFIFYKYVKRRNQFLLRLANGLPDRPMPSIVKRARYILSPLPKMSSWSKEKRLEVRELHKKLGNKWTEIGKKLFCAPSSAQDFINNIPQEKKGYWSLQESKTLVRTIKKVAGEGVFDTNRCLKSIPWTSISKDEKMEKFGRLGLQCRKHWHSVLSWKLSNPSSEWRSGWTKLDSAKLIYILYYAPWRTEEDIDWDIMKEIFSYVASYALIRDRWSGLKSKVPDWQVKSYRLMMAHLWEHKMPKLVKKDEDKKAVQDFYEEVKHCF